MADQYKKIHEIDRLTNELTPETLLEVEYTSEQFEGYMSFSATVEQIGYAIAKLVGYASDLDTNAKTIIDAINEVNKKAEEGGGGGGGGSKVTISDNPDGGVDITVDGEKRTLLKKNENIELKREDATNRVNNFITPEGVSVTRFDGDVGKEALALSTGENWGLIQVSAWENGVDKSAALGSEIAGSYLTMDDVTIRAPQLSDVLTHEDRIEALENGGTGEVTKDYVDNGFIAGPNVELDKRLGTTGAVFDAVGYCVTDKLYIDGSTTITWRCGNHQTVAAYLVLFDSSDTKIQYFKMSKDNYVINLADYPAYSYLRATFYITDDTHKTIEDTDGNILFEVDMVGKRVDGIVGLNERVSGTEETATRIDQRLSGLFNRQQFVAGNNTVQPNNIVDVEIEIGLDGYTVVGVVAYYIRTVGLVITRTQIADNKLYLRFYNPTSNALTINNSTVDVLYFKN